ncbi:MAG: serine hydrolase domain-containing protein [Aggregatilineales bacterium]
MKTLYRREFLKLAAISGTMLAAEPLSRLHAFADSTGRKWTITGDEVPELTSFDGLMQQFMQARSIPGGQLAVAVRGRLVYARGYTWNAKPDEVVQPTSIFQIASITKPFTSAAIMRLIQDGKFKLNDPLVSILDLTPPKSQRADPRLKQVTILNLLQHQGGWDRDPKGAFDPMFYDATIARALDVPVPISIKDIVTFMNGQPLQFDPGTKYVYSNYGYCLLGRVIETVTGQPYVQYVQDTVLTPLNIHGMLQGRSLLKDRAPNEVAYYSQATSVPSVFGSQALAKVPAPYGSFNIENMDSHGRWVANAIDLVRFAQSFDNLANDPVLSQESIAKTFAVPATGMDQGAYYACGWLVRPIDAHSQNTWHTGGLSGTYTLLVRLAGSIDYAVLFDQSDDPSGLSYDHIDGALHTVIDPIQNWPVHDLFPKYNGGIE